jgi:hypothetical protein
MGEPCEVVEFVKYFQSLYDKYFPGYPCGGGVEYLHRDPASRSRRRKGKSRI